MHEAPYAAADLVEVITSIRCFYVKHSRDEQRSELIQTRQVQCRMTSVFDVFIGACERIPHTELPHRHAQSI